MKKWNIIGYLAAFIGGCLAGLPYALAINGHTEGFWVSFLTMWFTVPAMFIIVEYCKVKTTEIKKESAS